ncbi:MAG: hypothetical protein M3Q07_27955 [Pseudobdellovibrionaceae bacterium]|nr:hypothetical protein [Pseudobdellovibrionaceae bacterium]
MPRAQAGTHETALPVFAFPPELHAVLKTDDAMRAFFKYVESTFLSRQHQRNKDGGILGKDAAAAKGDSGGPLFLDRIPYAPQSALVGVASGGKRVGSRVENYYLDLTSASSVSFLRSQGVL